MCLVWIGGKALVRHVSSRRFPSTPSRSRNGGVPGCLTSAPVSADPDPGTDTKKEVWVVPQSQAVCDVKFFLWRRSVLLLRRKDQLSGSICKRNFPHVFLAGKPVESLPPRIHPREQPKHLTFAPSHLDPSDLCISGIRWESLRYIYPARGVPGCEAAESHRYLPPPPPPPPPPRSADSWRNSTQLDSR